ncbi:MAG TPA: AfsR/SARP family transcriptional regulator, partial [Candidatus Limnocylindrales bacterium]|nr:AfsR/SARP family transcriptional regulator [Candidatus Limnocylindrales bacterium]
MEFRILGPLEVVDGTTVVRIAGGHERRLLLLLLIRAPQPVRLAAIVDALWPDDPPSSAQKVIQNYVLRLRKALSADMIATVADGYALVTEPDAVDAWLAAAELRRAKEALAAGDAAGAAALTSAALGRWRGQALADVRDEPFAQPEAARLDELRLAGIEDGYDAALAAGRHTSIIPELRQHTALHPLRERGRAQLMLALYRSGRQADALAEYRGARGALADQGLEPERTLRALEQAILNQAPELELPSVPAPTSVVEAPPVQRSDQRPWWMAA